MSWADDVESNDPTFVKDLENSQHTVWLVARWLSDRGYPTTVRPLRVRPNASQASEYADDGDIEIADRIEVKRRPDTSFTSLDTFPYPTVIVDVAHTWDNASPKPRAYFIVNAEGSHAIIVRGDTFAEWELVEKEDRKKGRRRRFYECPVRLCACVRITKP